MSGDIYLRAVKSGDLYEVVDQDGRKVADCTAIQVDAGSDRASVVTVTFFDHREGGGKIINRESSKMRPPPTTEYANPK